MSKAGIKYNERAWAIDVISKINLFCSKNNSPVKRAGGENTLKNDKNRLFPDVLLYGDEKSGTIIHGWELKMPDTPITDAELYNNAKLKADFLGANSFLLWNVKEAILYIREEQDFIAYKNWSINIKNRNEVQEKEREWVNLLHKILDFLFKFFSEKPFLITSLLKFNSNLYDNTINVFRSHLSTIFKDSCVKDVDFEIELIEWIEENYPSDKKEMKEKRYDILADFSILSWLNKFIFSHYLKTFNSHAEIITSLTCNSTLSEVIELFDMITKKCDFMNVFSPSVGDKYIDNYFLSYLLELNELLKGIRIEKIEPEYLHKIIDNAISKSKKKIAGQFSTPYNLAYYLAGITIKDRTANVLDPCCGTGTIAQAIYHLKRNKNILPQEALNTLWASDKFFYPLQLCSISLSDPNALGCLVQVFKADVFNLKNNYPISFIDPFEQKSIKRNLPQMHAIVSNLPFVRFEDAEKLNEKLKNQKLDNELNLSGKSDLYAYILLYLNSLIEDNGRIGVIISNSWLSSEWGTIFKNLIFKKYKILKIICSGKGKWFNNADVVTTLLILEKSANEQNDKIEFITTNKKLDEWNENILTEMIYSTISSKIKSNYITKQSYSKNEIDLLKKYGISWNALFSDFSWFNEIKNKLIKATEYMTIARGERRGWDNLFYPHDNNQIELQFIKPVILNSKELSNSLLGKAHSQAFCCSETIENLKKNNMIGALNWILKFEKATNNIGKLLPEVLKKPNHYWYEMKPETLADMVISMNPDKKICVYRLLERSFVNQRLIRMTALKESQIDILHALLNSAIGLLYIESIGFGRGLGALDLNATKISENLHILNPNLLTKQNKEKILKKFNKLLKRDLLDLPKELQEPDRIDFDEEVLKAFDIQLDVQVVYDTLLNIYHIRQTVKD